MDPTPRAEPPWTRADLAAGLATAVVAALLAIAPHLAMLARHGTAEFLEDGDEIAYLSISRAPYYGEWVVRDPFSGRWENAPTYYPWALFAPLAKLSRVLGLPLILTSLVWRLVGGLAFGGVLYDLARRLMADMPRPRAWAMGLALVCLCDVGFIEGRPLVNNARMVSYMARGVTPMPKADALPQYRVVSPLLNLPALLLVVGAVIPTAGTGRKSTAIGTLAMGLCVLLSFYMWTAAAATLGLYGLSLLVGWARRRGDPEVREPALRRMMQVAVILVGGLILGSPQTISNARTASDPQFTSILQRSAKVSRLPPGHPNRYRNLVNYWAWMKLIVGGVAILGLGRRRLVPVWCMAAAGYGLANVAFFTGLEFENTHWVYVYSPAGEILLIGAVAGLAQRWPGRWAGALWVVPAFLLATAAAWRPFEALHAAEPREYHRLLEELRPLRPELEALPPDRALVGPPEAKIALLSTRTPLIYHYQYSWNMSLVPLDVVHQRHALSGWLRGQEEADYTAGAGRDRNTMFLMSPEFEPDAVARERGAIFREIQAGRRPDLFTRYRPGYLLAPADAPAPTRDGPWALLKRSGRWALWERGRGEPSPPR